MNGILPGNEQYLKIYAGDELLLAKGYLNNCNIVYEPLKIIILKV